VFISSRSLYPEYRIDVIVEAFSIVLKKIPAARLTITGEGPEKVCLQNLTSSLGISGSVEFTGRLAPENVAATLQKSDIYVSIIESEGVSSSLLEACACQVYPIATDMPASRLIIEDGANGTLVKAGTTAGELAEILIRTAGNVEMRENAAKVNSAIIRESFDFKKNTAKFLEMYMKLIGKDRN
jgi:glycosyltransferase involved in cell wall biosynthesis